MNKKLLVIAALIGLNIFAGKNKSGKSKLGRPEDTRIGQPGNENIKTRYYNGLGEEVTNPLKIKALFGEVKSPKATKGAPNCRFSPKLTPTNALAATACNAFGPIQNTRSKNGDSKKAKRERIAALLAAGNFQ